LTHNAVKVACKNSDGAKCKYEQLKTTLMPEVSKVDKTETTLVFTGTNFFTSNFKSLASLDGIKADSIVIDSAT